MGTALNLAASFGALTLGTPGAVALHFSPVPYNLFLFLALWRLSRRPAPVVAAALARLVVVAVLRWVSDERHCRRHWPQPTTAAQASGDGHQPQGL